VIEDLLKKQRELMEQVPHGLRKDVFMKMSISKQITEDILEFLNSCGHKPWRPVPLSEITQRSKLSAIHNHYLSLKYAFDNNLEAEEAPEELGRQLISAFGVIEETIEYLNTIGKKPRKEKLEEITDILFFYLELVLLGGFSWAEIEEEYIRKHAVNLER